MFITTRDRLRDRGVIPYDISYFAINDLLAMAGYFSVLYKLQNYHGCLATRFGCVFRHEGLSDVAFGAKNPADSILSMVQVRRARVFDILQLAFPAF
jgi:hypothetical protein